MFDYPQRHQTHSSELPSDSALNACWKMNLNQVKPKIQAHGSKRIVILCDGKIPKPLMDRSSSLELTPSLNNSSSHTLSLHPILCSVKRHLERSLWRRWYGSDHQRREIMSVIHLLNSHLFIFLPSSFSRISLTVSDAHVFIYLLHIYQPHPELLLSAQAISSQDISVTPYITQVIFYQSGLGTSGDLSVGQGLLVFVEIIFWSQFMRVWVSDHKISGSYLYGVCVFWYHS